MTQYSEWLSAWTARPSGNHCDGALVGGKEVFKAAMLDVGAFGDVLVQIRQKSGHPAIFVGRHEVVVVG